ncbi:MAG: T9SS type A sorting domain-containing protein [Arcticibacter sp.]
MKRLLLLVCCIMLLGYEFTLAQCTTTNATSCACATAGATNCDLLPDIIVARPPLTVSGTNGVIEYSQSGNGSNDGRLRISASSPNVGHGPLEIRTTTTYICGTDTLTGTAPTTCPNTGLPPRQLIKQRVYQKNGNVMSYYDRDAGSMTYHPTHGHMHVDNWGVFTLRSATNDPNPLNWPIVGNGAKLAFCLMDYGSCSTYPGHCVDAQGNTLLNGNFPNYGLGGGQYNCSVTVQGISSGYTDIYYQSLDGMWINIPPGTCNGQYYIVVQLDPENYFLEENENNNVIAVPYTLTLQTAAGNPTIAASPSSVICPGGSVTLTASPATSYLWSTGATTQSIIVNQSGAYTVTTNGGSACSGSASINVTDGFATMASVSIATAASGTISSSQTVSFTATPINGGAAPSYQWKKNGVNVGTNSATYVNSAWVNGDQVSCVMTSNATCVTGSPATSNTITMSVVADPVRFLVTDITGNKGYYYDAGFGYLSTTNLSSTILNGVTNAEDVYVTASHAYVLDGVNKRVYRTNAPGTAAVQSRLLRTNTGKALGANVKGMVIKGDSLYVLDASTRSLYRYSLAAAYNGTTTNLNAVQKISLNSGNSSGEAVAFDGSYLYVLNNGTTKNLYRYTFAGTYSAVSRPLRTNTGGTLSTVTGAVVDGINLRIVDRGLDRSLTYPMASLFGSTTTLNATLYQVMNAANLNATGIALVANTSFLRNEDVLYGNEEWDRGTLLVNAYPNPTDGILHVRMDSKSTGDTPFVINIVDLNGKVVYSETTDSNLEWYELSIDLNQFGKGLYLVNVTKSTTMQSLRVVLQ